MPEQLTYILGIESSCDDTAAAVLADAQLLSNCIATQAIHEAYGGVVPELASRAHQANIVPVVDQALSQANIDKKQLHAIAYTRGPGLLGSLLVGASFAKSLALALNIPLIEVNHLHGHLMAHFIADTHPKLPTFPCLGVTISGGHTQIVRMKSSFEIEILGETQDDAIGEAFDKCGKVMGLGYPAGPEIDKRAQLGNPTAFQLPNPKMPGYHLSYSGLKTAFLNLIHKHQQKEPDFVEKHLNDLCASLQYALIQPLMKQLDRVLANYPGEALLVGGGVAANSAVRKALYKREEEQNCEVYLPPLKLTTDNAAMIGIVGYLKYKEQQFSDLNVSAKARLPF